MIDALVPFLFFFPLATYIQERKCFWSKIQMDTNKYVTDDRKIIDIPFYECYFIKIVKTPTRTTLNISSQRTDQRYNLISGFSIFIRSQSIDISYTYI